ncbi:MAG: hypothetical protein AAFO91_09685, partial [Bacteroidota bacterium]
MMELSEDLKNCDVCEGSYLAYPNDDDEYKCVTDADFANCHKGNGTGGCEACYDDYFKVAGTDKACAPRQCKLNAPRNPSICLVCNDNKDFVEDNDLGCVDQATPNDCLNFSGMYQTCIKCSDSSKRPFTGYLADDLKSDNPIFIKTINFECRTVDISDSYYSEFVYEYMFFHSSKSKKDHTFATTYQIIETPTLFSRLSHKGVDEKDRENTICVPNLTPGAVADCSYFGSVFCESCDSNFYLKEPNECAGVETPAHDSCTVVTNVNSSAACTECLEDHFLANGACTARTEISLRPACRTPVEDKDQCEVCFEGNYLDAADGTCKPNTAENCATKSSTENLCETCVLGAFIDESDEKKCKFYTNVENCEVYEDAEDKCKTCTYAYYLNENTCVKSTKTKCKTFKENENACETCGSNFTIEDTDCSLKTKEACLTFETANNACAS